MGWLRKKKDPISERARALETEIKQLEARIQELSIQADPPPEAAAQRAAPTAPRTAVPAGPQPRLRSTALPGGHTVLKPGGAAPARPAPEQVFEEVDHKRLHAPPEAASRALYNELGMRKYDLPGAWQRLRNFFRGSSAQNQTLVKLLAAGNIQGLRPLRYEKRVARRRFLVFVFILFVLLWGIIAMFLRR
jgi:hypothetical protein